MVALAKETVTDNQTGFSNLPDLIGCVQLS
jgi:hypothetical protein